MPKSISSLQTQIATCEQHIQQAIDLFVYMADGQDVQYSVNLNDFIKNIYSEKKFFNFLYFCVRMHSLSLHLHIYIYIYISFIIKTAE